jgi:4-hydroxyphenylpyruvate dioxygenase-like putative hemolysin
MDQEREMFALRDPDGKVLDYTVGSWTEAYQSAKDDFIELVASRSQEELLELMKKVGFEIVRVRRQPEWTVIQTEEKNRRYCDEDLPDDWR